MSTPVLSLIITTPHLVPPHGSEQIQELQSIFEISHLRPEAIFLDIQCKYYNQM